MTKWQWLFTRRFSVLNTYDLLFMFTLLLVNITLPYESVILTIVLNAVVHYQSAVFSMQMERACGLR